jgi:hypothetical protein
VPLPADPHADLVAQRRAERQALANFKRAGLISAQALRRFRLEQRRQGRSHDPGARGRT